MEVKDVAGESTADYVSWFAGGIQYQANVVESMEILGA